MLNLHYNKLERLPDSFIHLSNLEYLSISYNQLCSIPQGFGEHFEKLEFLNLENNQLSSDIIDHKTGIFYPPPPTTKLRN